MKTPKPTSPIRRACAVWASTVLLVLLTLFACATAWFVGTAILTVTHTEVGAPHTSGTAAKATDHRPDRPLGWPACEDDRELMLEDPPMYGDDVRELQSQLRLLGFYKGPISGYFDVPTSEALKAFQKSTGARQTGVMTHDLWYALSPAPVSPPPVAVEPPRKPQGTVSIVIDTRKLRLTVYDDGKPFKTFPCAIGKPSTPTPIGEFMVKSKWTDPGGPFGVRWMGLNIPWGTYGIHGTNRPHSIGTMASAGCIRMFNHHVTELYPWIPIGTQVKIDGPQPTARVERTIKMGDTGTDVQYVQYRVRQAGFNPGMVDGRFGSELREALLEIQRFYGLPITGTAGPNEFHVLGIK